MRRALILAAGRGRPIADPELPNCLAVVGGEPLLQRTLRVLARHGVREVGLVVGWQGERLRAAAAAILAGDAKLAGVTLALFDNPSWQGPNGLSVLAAREFLRQSALVVMADQIAAPHLVGELLALGERSEHLLLGVDRGIARVFDLADATKVRFAPDPAAAAAPGRRRVAAISKELPTYEAVSASLLVAGPSLLACLDELPRPSLTEGLARAADLGWLFAHDLGEGLWQDVDSADMRLHAEWLLRVHGDELAQPEARASLRAPGADTMALVEELLAKKDEPRFTLLTPGPVMTSARVKASLVHHDVNHREVDYESVVKRLQAKLKPVFGAGPEHELVMLTGSGTAAMEMAISSVVPRDRKLLVLSNGAFGDRLAEIARVHGIAHEVWRYPVGDRVRADDVERALSVQSAFAVVAMIHHETSVGLLNPVAEVGRICRAHDRLLIVDAVSSLGGEDVDVVRDNIDICYASANKCLHAVAGVSFACVGPRVWPRIEEVEPRSFYLGLKRYRKYLADLNQTPFTPAVSASLALEAALDELAENGGVPARRALYRWRNLRIRQALAGLGFRSFTDSGFESHVISTLRVPPVITAAELHARMRARGFITYRCKSPLAEDHIQIANMGELSDAAIDDFLSAASAVIKDASGRTK